MNDSLSGALEHDIPVIRDDYRPTEISQLTVKEMPADDQPRERVRKFGIGSLSTADLFALILRTGTSGYPVTTLCRDLMEMNDNLLLNLERKTREQIMELKGIGELKAMQIEAVMEIVRRYCSERVPERPQIKSSQSVYDIMRDRIGNLPYEQMWALFLNRANCVFARYKISEGGSSATVFDTKKLIRNALLSHAEAIVLCHNHPSGTLRPSGPDDAITRKCKEACQALDIRLLDHVIITASGYYSYNDSSSLLS